MTVYLDLPVRTLRDMYDEIAAHVLDRERRQEALIWAKTAADLELRFTEADALAEEHDRLGDELGPLLDRLEELEEELAWLERGEDARERPMVL